MTLGATAIILLSLILSAGDHHHLRRNRPAALPAGHENKDNIKPGANAGCLYLDGTPGQFVTVTNELLRRGRLILRDQAINDHLWLLQPPTRPVGTMSLGNTWDHGSIGYGNSPFSVRVNTEEPEETLATDALPHSSPRLRLPSD